jgi:hypothetical protein
MMHSDPKVKKLVSLGATVHGQGTVFIAEDVDLDRIASDVVLHPGCRIRGAATSIGPECVLGEDGPVCLSDSQLGRNVHIRGGSVDGATLLDGVRIGPCAHIRPATLLEEQASCGHSVGLKQTLLMPFVTLGSLINFCDCLMAGGTGPRNHGEVGSSYVHFNFTPQQDKATPSAIGDVPRGVMLDQPPIFLGGQGGLVGPSRIAYGTVIAAGVVCRKDIMEEGKLVFTHASTATVSVDFRQDRYGGIGRKLINNLNYLGNLHAFRQWYRHVRSRFAGPAFRQACHHGALQRIDAMIEERVDRLDRLAKAIRHGLADTDKTIVMSVRHQQEAFACGWEAVRSGLGPGAFDASGAAHRDAFLDRLQTCNPGTDYVEWIQGFDRETRTYGIRWLNAVVDAVSDLHKGLQAGGEGAR